MRAEILFLDFGLLASLYVAYRIAAAYGDTFLGRMRAVIPWAGLVTLLFAAGVWIVLQPMEMRGTLQPGEPLPMASTESAPLAADPAIGAASRAARRSDDDLPASSAESRLTWLPAMLWLGLVLAGRSLGPMAERSFFPSGPATIR